MKRFVIYIQDIMSLIQMEKLVFFNKESEKADKVILLDLLGKLIDRLNELNDGSFEIDDRETERIKNL